MLHLLEQLFMCLRPTHAVMKLRGLRGSESLPLTRGEVRWGPSGFAIFTTEKVPTKPHQPRWFGCWRACIQAPAVRPFGEPNGARHKRAGRGGSPAAPRRQSRSTY